MKPFCAWGDDVQVYLWLQGENFEAGNSMRCAAEDKVLLSDLGIPTTPFHFTWCILIILLSCLKLT